MLDEAAPRESEGLILQTDLADPDHSSRGCYCANVDFIIALRKFVRSGTTRKPTPGTTLARLRLISGSVASIVFLRSPN